MTRRLPIIGAVAAVLAACGDAGAERREAAAAEAAALLADDPSAALRRAKEGLVEHGTSAPLHLAAARACLALDRLSDAIDHAERGLRQLREAREDDAPLAANLEGAAGEAHMRRYLEIADEQDWSAANVALERAVRAGDRRIEWAYRAALLQQAGPHEDDARMLKFARIVLDEAPDSDEASKLRGALESLGLDP